MWPSRVAHCLSVHKMDRESEIYPPVGRVETAQIILLFYRDCLKLFNTLSKKIVIKPDRAADVTFIAVIVEYCKSFQTCYKNVLVPSIFAFLLNLHGFVSCFFFGFNQLQPLFI